MMATEQVVTRADIEATIADLRAKQNRMPAHWTQRREEVAVELELLVLEWLATEA